jgi:hypothetical protein
MVWDATTPHLQPLPIMGLGYRWSLNFASPLNLIVQHNLYVLVMIKHFLTWLKLVPLSNCNNEGVAHAFFNKTFSKFLSCVVCVLTMMVISINLGVTTTLKKNYVCYIFTS